MTVLVLMMLSGFEFVFVEVFLLSTFTFGLILDCCLNLIPACKRSVLLIFEARILTCFFYSSVWHQIIVLAYQDLNYL